MALFGPSHSLESVARQLAEGLENGTLYLPQTNEPASEQESLQLRELIHQAEQEVAASIRRRDELVARLATVEAASANPSPSHSTSMR